MVRFIHAADIHLDSPMRQLQKYEGAPVDEMRQTTRRALSNLIDLAIHEHVDFVLIAGDLYDGDWPDHNTGLFFASEVRRLRAADIPLYFISGNHDAANKLTKALPLPSNPDGTQIMLSSRKVESVKLEDLGVVIHGRGFKEQAEKDNLAEKYPKALSGLRNIGMLHTSLQGAAGHTPYAPCTPEELADKGYDYWALGHIHIRGDRAIEGSCPVVFSGNTQGRSVRECGVKGCYVVEFASDDKAKLTFHPLDVCRWEVCEIDATGVDNIDDLASNFISQTESYADQHEGLPIIVRARIVGTTPLHRELHARYDHWQSAFRQATFEIDSSQVWMERLRVDTNMPTERRIAEFSGPISELSNLIDSLATDGDAVSDVMQALGALAKKLPPELTEGEDGLDLEDPNYVAGMIREAHPLLLDRLSRTEVEA